MSHVDPIEQAAWGGPFLSSAPGRAAIGVLILKTFFLSLLFSGLACGAGNRPKILRGRARRATRRTSTPEPGTGETRGERIVPWASPQRVALESFGRSGRPVPVPVARGQVAVSGNLCLLRKDAKDHRWWRRGSLWLRDGRVVGLILDRHTTVRQALHLIEAHRETIETVTWRLTQRPWDRSLLTALARVRSTRLCLYLDAGTGTLNPLAGLENKLYALWIHTSRDAMRAQGRERGDVRAALRRVPALSGLRYFGTDSAGACYLTPGSVVDGRWSAGACRPVTLSWPGQAATGRSDVSLATHVVLNAAPGRDAVRVLSKVRNVWSLSGTEAGLSTFLSVHSPEKMRRLRGFRVAPGTIASLVSRAKGLLELGLWGTWKQGHHGGTGLTVCSSCLQDVEALALVSDSWLELFRQTLPGMVGLRALLLAGTGRALRSLPKMHLSRLEMLVIDTTRTGQPVMERWLHPFAPSALPLVSQSEGTGVDLDARTLASFSSSPIKTLVLRGSHCSNDLGRFISRLSRLEHLDLSGCRGLDASILPSLSRLRHLRVLDLSHQKITASQLGFLSNLSNLEVLNLADNRLDDESAQSFSSLRKLQVLVVSLNPGLTAGFLAGLSGLHGLEVLAISHVGERPLSRWPLLTGRGLHVLASLSGLRYIDIAGWRVGMDAMKALWSLPDLRTLRMDLVDPGSLSVASLAGRTEIDHLYLGLAPATAGSDDEGHAEAVVAALRKRFSRMKITYDNVPGVVASPIDVHKASTIPAGW